MRPKRRKASTRCTDLAALGTVGVLRPRQVTGERTMLVHLIREVERGVELSDAEAQNNVNFAVRMRDTSRDERCRMRGAELLEAMRTRGVNVAMYIDKGEREDAAVNNGAGMGGNHWTFILNLHGRGTKRDHDHDGRAGEAAGLPAR